MRDALGQTINLRTGRVSGTGVHARVYQNNFNYLNGRYNSIAFSDGLSMTGDIISAGFTSFQNRTQFYQWNYNGVNCFTVLRPQGITNFGLIPMDGFEYVLSGSTRNMTKWLMMNDSKEKTIIKRWNDFCGWESRLAWRCK